MKIFLCLAAWLFFPAQGFAQAGGQKTLLVIRDFDDRLKYVMAIGHAVQLKRAGVDVHVLFEGEAVLNFISNKINAPPEPFVPDLFLTNGVLTTTYVAAPDGQGSKRITRHKHADIRRVPANNPSDNIRKWWDKPALDGGTPVEYIDPYEYKDIEMLADLEKNVPYTVCSFSAVILDVYEELKAEGKPLSKDAASPVDLSKFLNDGYSVRVF